MLRIAATVHPTTPRLASTYGFITWLPDGFVTWLSNGSIVCKCWQSALPGLTIEPKSNPICFRVASASILPCPALARPCLPPLLLCPKCSALLLCPAVVPCPAVLKVLRACLFLLTILMLMRTSTRVCVHAQRCLQSVQLLDHQQSAFPGHSVLTIPMVLQLVKQPWGRLIQACSYSIAF